MKKQTKAKKQQVIQHSSKCVACNRWQRIWGVIALAGLFACGLFVGMAINSPKISQNQDVATEQVAEPEDICVEVERLLLRGLPAASDKIDDRIDRAKIYVSLAERGCIENTDKYAELARQELEIARAIDNDNFDHAETIDMVETYKRLNMKAAAQEIFEKAKKLTDPAIEFIIQVEKIINE